MHKLSLLTAFAFVALATPRAARADAPLPPPTTTHFCNHDESVCVTSDPGAGDAPGKTVATRGGKTLWTMARWFRDGALSPDGRSIVDIWDMVPQDIKPGDPVIRCYRDGKLLRAVTLGQLVPDRARLQKTVSHFIWGKTFREINDGGQIEITTVEDKRFVLATPSCTLSAAK